MEPSRPILPPEGPPPDVDHLATPPTGDPGLPPIGVPTVEAGAAERNVGALIVDSLKIAGSGLMRAMRSGAEAGRRLDSAVEARVKPVVRKLKRKHYEHVATDSVRKIEDTEDDQNRRKTIIEAGSGLKPTTSAPIRKPRFKTLLGIIPRAREQVDVHNYYREHRRGMRRVRTFNNRRKAGQIDGKPLTYIDDGIRTRTTATGEVVTQEAYVDPWGIRHEGIAANIIGGEFDKPRFGGQGFDLGTPAHRQRIAARPEFSQRRNMGRLAGTARRYTRSLERSSQGVERRKNGEDIIGKRRTKKVRKLELRAGKAADKADELGTNL